MGARTTRARAVRASAVIGASYGDEGKGRTVDALVRAGGGPGTLVVRSNGGAQAGHTVVDAAGARHVFHHVGSGALGGAATHLSRHMVSHPIVFAAERARLAGLGACVAVAADGRGPVTTPWDMMVNQAAELARDRARHGSCGLGFGETVGRCENPAYALTVADLARPTLPARLRAIRDVWLPARVAELGLDPTTGPLAFAREDGVMDRFVDGCAAFARVVTLCPDADIGEADQVVFQGAQGLLLDQRAPGFPFLTRSNTGLANMAAIAAEAGLAGVDALYVTRPYLTRHGRGPMADERPIDRWFAVDDPTNQPNPWQETLRLGLLDPVALGGRLAHDLTSATDAVAVTASVAVTCLDQIPGRAAWLKDGQVREGSSDELVAAVAEATNLPITARFASPENKMQKLLCLV